MRLGKTARASRTKTHHANPRLCEDNHTMFLWRIRRIFREKYVSEATL